MGVVIDMASRRVPERQKITMPRTSPLPLTKLTDLDNFAVIEQASLEIEIIHYCLQHDLEYGLPAGHKGDFLQWLEGRYPCDKVVKWILTPMSTLHDGDRIVWCSRKKRPIQLGAQLEFTYINRHLSARWVTSLNRC